MKNVARKMMTILLCLALALAGTGVPEADAAGGSPKLSLQSKTLKEGQSFTLKVKNGKKVTKTKWSVNKSGKDTVTLSDKKKTAVTVTGMSDGTASVKAKVTYKSGDREKTTNLTCQVTVKPAAVAKNGDIVILYTSDIHCGIDQNFGLVGLQQVRDTFEAQGYTTLLVDDGDAIQGEPVGTLSKGSSIIDLMNDLKYDVAIPGNHEFDYGMDNFLELTQKANFPYISCNFNKGGQLIFPPYIIKEVCGKKIAFVGVTTPKTLVTSTPAYFQNEAGEFIYGFLQDDTGEGVYNAVQKAVNDARAEGADYVYVMGHMGESDDCKPWTYADVISHTNGIDVFLDGHSHDTDQVVMKNKDGKDVIRTACGTQMECIGYSIISAEKGITDTNIWSWPSVNSESAPSLLGIKNAMTDKVAACMEMLDAQLEQVVAKTDVLLTVNDPTAVDASGNPIRMIRRAETNLGDFCADAFLTAAGDADIAIHNGGCIRANIEKGDITYGDILSVFPYGNMLCVVEATGQQVLDALEWSVRKVPSECGGFLQVAGITFTVDTSVNSTCTEDDAGMFTGVSGARRVKDVKVGDAPIDPEKTYKVAGINYSLLDKGDGFTMFAGDKVLQDNVKLDNQLLIDYITVTLGGTVGAPYDDPTGQGRITIK